MGAFSTRLRVWNPAKQEEAEELDAVVDTGERFSWISRARLERLGVRPARRTSRVIEGRVVEREMACVYIAAGGFSAPDLVGMAGPGEIEVLGTRTIEGMGLVTDSVGKKLVPAVGLGFRIR
jgi:predicted aspartyl protease